MTCRRRRRGGREDLSRAEGRKASCLKVFLILRSISVVLAKHLGPKLGIEYFGTRLWFNVETGFVDACDMCTRDGEWLSAKGGGVRSVRSAAFSHG